MSAYGLDDGDIKGVQATDRQGAVPAQAPADIEKVPFRLEFETSDREFVALAREFPSHASVLMAYWHDDKHRKIPLYQDSHAIYHASPELSELYVFRAVKHASEPSHIAQVLAEPPTKEYQIALPMTVDVEVELTSLPNSGMRLTMVSYSASKGEPLAESHVFARSANREGHYRITEISFSSLENQ